MPEYYEVDRIKNYLIDASILNQSIIAASISEKGLRLFKNIAKDDVKRFFLNNTIRSIQTKAKYTLFICERGAFLCHYRFTGIPHVEGDPYGDRLQSIYSLPIAKFEPNYIRFSLTFKHNKVFHYVDTRCLSHIHIDLEASSFADFKSTQSLPEDIAHFTFLPFNQWKEGVKRTSLDIKTYLLNQHYPPSGIGNYLACEICHEARLSPWKKIKDFSRSDYDALVKATSVIKQHCQKNSDYSWFKVYNQKQCRSCHGVIFKQKHKGKSSQSTTWCSFCQS